MKRKDLFLKLWIPIRKQLPPATENDILCYNHQTKRVSIWRSVLARMHAEAELGKDPYHSSADLSYDRHISHWMPLWGVDGLDSSDYAAIREEAIRKGHELREKETRRKHKEFLRKSMPKRRVIRRKVSS